MCTMTVPAFGSFGVTKAGNLPMVFPTIKTLQQLSSYHRADEALAALGRSRVPTIVPRLVGTSTGIGMEVDP